MAKTTSKTTSKTKSDKQKAENKQFTLPRYLKLAKGAMWFDTDGEQSSGVRLYAIPEKFIGRGDMHINEDFTPAKGQPDVPKDKFNNINFNKYGMVDVSVGDLSWYVDTTAIPPEKQSRLILAYKHRILVEADPKNPPKITAKVKEHKKVGGDFKTNEAGELAFVGKNKEMFHKLQNLNFPDLAKFIETCPKTESAKNNLIDMYHYEVKGYNRVSRARLEVLDRIRNKLKEFGPTMSSIRINED